MDPNSTINDKVTWHTGLEKFPEAVHSVTAEIEFDLPELKEDAVSSEPITKHLSH